MSTRELPWSIRAGLRLLPRSYREHRAAEIRATVEDAEDAGRISAGAEALSLVALGIRVRGGSIVAPPSPARTRAAAIAAVVLPVVLAVPASRAIALGTNFDSGVRFSGMMPAWISAVIAALLTLGGAARWAHRSSILATVLFIGGLLILVSTTNLDAAVREFGWLPLLATAAAVNRVPGRVLTGRRILGITGVAVLTFVSAGAAVAYVATDPSWSYWLPSPLDGILFNSRIVIGTVLLLICLTALGSRTARAAVPVVAALGMVYVGAALEANLWPAPDQLATGPLVFPVGHLIVQLVAAPLLVFVGARALTALADRASGPPDRTPLAT